MIAAPQLATTDAHPIGRLVDQYLASNMSARQEAADAELARKLAETSDLMKKAGMV